MTAQEMEIQELRRRVKFLEEKNKELEHLHQLDMAAIVRLRRGGGRMTAQEMEIQELRRRVKFLEEKNKELEHLHQLDMAAIVRLRRQIDCLEGVEDAKDQPAP